MKLLVEDNLQAVFSFVAANMLTQLERSQYGTRCVYRSHGGKKCAGGFLIPDECYTFRMEGKSISDLEFFQENYPNSINLIYSLQRIHDLSVVQEWRKELAKLGCRYGLNIEACYTPFPS